MITSTLREEDHEEDNRYQQSDNVNYYQQQKSVNEAALDNASYLFHLFIYYSRL